MKQWLLRLVSMEAAVFLMVAFAAIIGSATFIENDFGTQTARALVYKAKWFELFLFYFIIVLIYNILRYKTYKTRFPVFLFHSAFVVIAIGALITRYFGYEGIMHIREGATKQTMVSDVKMLDIAAGRGKPEVVLSKPVYFSTLLPNRIHETLKVGDKHVDVALLKYLPIAEEKLVKDAKNGKTVLEMKISAGGRGRIHYIEDGEIEDLGNFYVSYNVSKLPTDKPTFAVSGAPEALKVTFPFNIFTMSMDTRKQSEIPGGTNDLKRRTLYRFGSNAVVLKDVHRGAKVVAATDKLKSKAGQPEYIKMRICVDKQCKDEVFKPIKNEPGKIHRLSLNGVDIEIRVGAKVITLPFAIRLDDFRLERYPGSMTPASYSSYVTLIDKEENLTMPYHIYMNHVLDHRRYRFFQSSYDPDEHGTVLSVNHDPGALPTYLGYLLLAIGMIWSLFSPKSRFQTLLKRARKLQDEALAASLLAALFLFAPQHADAASPHVSEAQLKHMQKYDITHALKLGHLVAQDKKGRMKPVDTVAHEVIAKLTGKTSVFGLDPMQLFLGMTVEPEFYQDIPMIKIKHPKIAKKLGLDTSRKYAAFSDFFDENGKYKIFDDVSVAVRKKPLEQSAYDKELIKTDERVNVAFMTYQGSLLRIYPKPNDKNNKWVSPLDAIKTFPPKEAEEARVSIAAYFTMVSKALKDGNWSSADLALRGLHKIQAKYGSAVLPSASHIKWEIRYNQLNLFSKLVLVYLLTGLFLLIAAFTNVIKPAFKIKWSMRIALTLLWIGFALHVAGMAIRWYIAGHAPWSNAYESIVFIAGATMLAGLIIARRSPFALGGAAILAGITMGVAHMSFVNPEITNLVPVLKSYWLMIHVATIISGDGFLGLGSILALLVLILYIVRGKSGHEGIDRSIKELSNLSEMALIVGLYLLTVGNFLGGVWANESWGRYWGWDSKETWAAVTILVYAAVLHMRFVPFLRSNFAFIVAATWAYFSVLMTYFGVNYYLSGLHSYAAGDPLPIPTWVYVAVASLAALTLIASRNRKLA